MHSESFDLPVANAVLRVREAHVDAPPMLLVHGGPGGVDYLFKFFAVPLKRHGWRAVSYVQRGSPGSPCDGPFLIPDFVEDIEAIRRKLGTEKIALLGHSWGGLLAVLYAAKYPGRVERLVLLCPIGPRTGWRTEFWLEVERRLSPQELRTYHQLLREAEGAPTREEHDRLMVQRYNVALPAYYAPRHRREKPGLAHLEYRVRTAIMNQLDGLYGDPSWEEPLRSLRAPVAILYGKEDPIPEKVIEDYRLLFASPLIVPLEGVGHFPWIEDPHDFQEALHFALEDAARAEG